MENIETGTIRIGANEAIPFLPSSEIKSGKSPWNRFTLDTDSRTADIQYRYRYKGKMNKGAGLSRGVGPLCGFADKGFLNLIIYFYF
jgi:hypothetical protein